MGQKPSSGGLTVPPPFTGPIDDCTPPGMGRCAFLVSVLPGCDEMPCKYIKDPHEWYTHQGHDFIAVDSGCNNITISGGWNSDFDKMDLSFTTLYGNLRFWTNGTIDNGNSEGINLHHTGDGIDERIHPDRCKETARDTGPWMRTYECDKYPERCEEKAKDTGPYMWIYQCEYECGGK